MQSSKRAHVVASFLGAALVFALALPAEAGGVNLGNLRSYVIGILDSLGLMDSDGTANVVTGPSSSTDATVPVFSGTGGETLTTSTLSVPAAGTLLAPTAVVIGAASTAGVRLEVDANGNLATREGDDSAAARLVVHDGTAALPAITGASDNADTGLYFPSANTVGLGASGGTYTVTLSSVLAGNGLGMHGFTRATVARTSDGSETATNSWLYITNTGASGTVTRTLPATAGFQVAYIRRASQAFRIEPSSGTSFRRTSGTLETANKYLELASDGAMIEVLFDGTEWQVLSEKGTINVEP